MPPTDPGPHPAGRVEPAAAREQLRHHLLILGHYLGVIARLADDAGPADPTRHLLHLEAFALEAARQVADIHRLFGWPPPPPPVSGAGLALRR